MIVFIYINRIEVLCGKTLTSSFRQHAAQNRDETGCKSLWACTIRPLIRRGFCSDCICKAQLAVSIAELYLYSGSPPPSLGISAHIKSCQATLTAGLRILRFNLQGSRGSILVFV